MHRLKAALLLRIKVLLMDAILLVLLTVQAQSTESGSPVVRAVFFFSPTCPHCEYVREEVLPPLVSRFGSKLQVAAINTTTPSGYELFLNACMKHGNLRLSVPMLIVGNTAMIGDKEIPRKFPELIEKNIAAGGIDWPNIQGLSAMVTANPVLSAAAPQRKEPPAAAPGAAVSEPVSTSAKPQVKPAPEQKAAAKEARASEPIAVAPAPKPSPIPSATERAGAGPAQKSSDNPILSVPLASVNESSRAKVPFSSRAVRPEPSGIIDLTGGEAEFGLAERFKRDVYGNGLAILVLAGMVLTLLVSPIILKKASIPVIEDIRPRFDWLIPILALIGLGVAAYLSNVEVRHVEAVCGPVGDCNTVNQSRYARLFGVLPIGVLGFFGFLAILAAWTLRRWGSVKLALLAAVSISGMTAFGTLFSVYLTFVEPFVIGATCLWCLSSAVIMTTLFLLALKPGLQAFQALRSADTLVAVGTALASGPPHRSVLARLAHTAPTSDKDVEALFRPRMQNTGGRQPFFCELFHTVPRETALLASTAQGLIPQPRALSSKGTQCGPVSRDGMVGKVSPNHRGEPVALLDNGLMHPLSEFSFHLM
jgi:uncharacterized membrane protein